jgi:hypothetical protein
MRRPPVSELPYKPLDVATNQAHLNQLVVQIGERQIPAVSVGDLGWAAARQAVELYTRQDTSGLWTRKGMDDFASSDQGWDRFHYAKLKRLDTGVSM